MSKRLFAAVLLLFCFLAPVCLQAENFSVSVQTTAVSASGVQKSSLENAAAAAEHGVVSPQKNVPQKKNPFVGSFWALVPPLVAIILALVTKEVYSSLFAGVVLGGLFTAEFSLLAAADCVVSKGLIEAVKSTAGIFIFLVILGMLVSLINKTGGAAAFGKWALKRIKSRTGAILATFFLGILIFIDDYFNCLTVGNVMLPVADSQKISRAKLAYIVDATAAPVCMIAPISSWAAAVTQYAAGSGKSGLELFICAIPFNFYSLLTLLFIVLITVLHIDFGPMARHEKNAIEKGDLFSGAEKVDSEVRIGSGKGQVFDMILPVIMLILCSVGALLYAGGILTNGNFIAAFGNTDASLGLPLGALPVLCLTIFYLLCRKVITFKEAAACIPQGFNAMVPAVLILTLATALKNMTTLLEAKEFIALMIGGSAEDLFRFLPAVIFVAAIGLSFSTGTAWGTFGILIPIVVGIFPASSPLFSIGISACLAGAVCGDHCSPISDTTIMSSAGTCCDHISHVTTQLPYALTVAAFSFGGFLFAGFVPHWFIVFPILALLMIVFLLFIKFFILLRCKVV